MRQRNLFWLLTLLLCTGVFAEEDSAPLPGSAEVMVHYLDQEGRTGAFRLVWSNRSNGFSMRVESVSPHTDWSPLLYEKEKERRTVRRGYEMWLAPHHLNELIGTTPFRLRDLETIDRWIRGEVGDLRSGKAWEQVFRGESWWKAERVTTREVKSSGGSNATATAKSIRGGR